MKGWEEVELGLLIETLKGCAFKSSEYVYHGVPVVRISDFTENSISTDELMYYTEENANKYITYKLNHWDILIQTVGSWQFNPASIVGKVVKVPKNLEGSLLNQNIVKIIPTKDVENKFLYYRLKDESFKFYNLGCAQGAANQASITLSSIRKFKFLLPPLPTQRRIASILSAYDDLIENNLKRINLLEELAQRTYEEWFVKFNVNNEKLTINKDTGLPDGWEIIPIGSFVKFQKGKKANIIIEEFREGFEKLLLLDGIESGKYPYTESKGQVIAERGDLIMLMDGARSSKVFFADKGVVGSTISKIVISNNNISSTLLKHYFESNFEWMQINNTGAAIPHANKNFINKMPFKLPTKEILKKWALIIESIYKQIQNLKDQNLQLKSSRDILLPRLMNGKIEINDGD